MILGIPDAIRETRAEMLRSGGGAQFNSSERECVHARFGSAWTSERYVDDPHKILGYIFACALLVNLIRAHCLLDGKQAAGVDMFYDGFGKNWLGP